MARRLSGVGGREKKKKREEGRSGKKTRETNFARRKRVKKGPRLGSVLGGHIRKKTGKPNSNNGGKTLSELEKGKGRIQQKSEGGAGYSAGKRAGSSASMRKQSMG